MKYTVSVPFSPALLSEVDAIKEHARNYATWLAEQNGFPPFGPEIEPDTEEIDTPHGPLPALVWRWEA